MSGGVALIGDWQKAFKLLREAPKRIDKAIQRQLLQEAHHIRERIVSGIDRGGPPGSKFAPHSPITIAVRRFSGGGRGTKILIASSALRNGVAVIPQGKGVVLVAVRRRKGNVNLAHIHEFGRQWSRPMTAKQRRFLFAALRAAGMQRARPKGAAGSASVTIRIPARPYFWPVVNHLNVEQMRARFAAAIAAALKA